MRLSPLCLIPFALLTFAACSDPVPPTPRGAWTVIFSDLGIGCAQNSHATRVGDVDASNKKQVITDGTEGAKISCQVSAAGSGFDVDASANQSDKFLIIAVKGLTAAATKDAPMPGVL